MCDWWLAVKMAEKLKGRDFFEKKLSRVGLQETNFFLGLTKIF